MKLQKTNINVEVDWDELDTFWADQYEVDYGKYSSYVSEDGAFKFKESFNQFLPQNPEQAISI
jgi:hypothetical protein